MLWFTHSNLSPFTFTCCMCQERIEILGGFVSIHGRDTLDFSSSVSLRWFVDDSESFKDPQFPTIIALGASKESVEKYLCQSCVLMTASELKGMMTS